ncbi:MAG: hypothetical protein V7K48_22830 [Nostoc sp.]
MFEKTALGVKMAKRIWANYTRGIGSLAIAFLLLCGQAVRAEVANMETLRPKNSPDNNSAPPRCSNSCKDS